MCNHGNGTRIGASIERGRVVLTCAICGRRVKRWKRRRAKEAA